MEKQRKFLTMLVLALVTSLALTLVAGPVMAQGDGEDGDQGPLADETTTADVVDDTTTDDTAVPTGAGQAAFLSRWAEVQLTPEVVVYAPQECVAAPFWGTRTWPSGDIVADPGMTVLPEFDESQQFLATIICDVAVFDTPGGIPVGGHRLLAGQTWFVKPYLWVVPGQQFGATDFGFQVGTDNDGLSATDTSTPGEATDTTDGLGDDLGDALSTPDATDSASDAS